MKKLLVFISFCMLLTGCVRSHLDIFPPLEDPSLIEQAIAPELLRADIDAFVQGIAARHPNFDRYADQQALMQLSRELKAQITSPMTRTEFFKYIGQLSHTFNDGHSFLIWPYQEYTQALAQGSVSFPFAVEWDGAGLFIKHDYLENQTGRTLAASSEITAINGASVQEIMRHLQRYVGGETRALRDAFVVERFPVMLWSVFGVMDDFEMTLKVNDQLETLAILSAQQWQSSSRTVAEQSTAEDYSFAVVAPGVGLLTVTSFDVKPKAFESYMEATFAQINDLTLHSLIVDIRANTGGNTDTATALASYFSTRPFRMVSRVTEKLNDDNRGVFGYKGASGQVIEAEWSDYVSPKADALRFNGKVYVMIGPATYSAAIVYATAMQDNDLGVLVGLPTGGFANQTAQGNLFNLPNSQLRAYVATKMLVRPNGDSSAGVVIPDIELNTQPRTAGDEQLYELLNLIEISEE